MSTPTSRLAVDRLVAALALMLTMAACAGAVVPGTPSPSPLPPQPTIGPFPADVVEGLRTETDITFTEVTECGGTPCTVPGDVLAPTTGADLPTVVLLNGGGTAFADRRYQAPLAAELARRGAVVFLMSYRSIATGNYASAGSNDVRCAIGYARAQTERFGGDPDRVIVVGHSQGGFHATEVALEPVEEADGCLYANGGKPEGVIGLGSPIRSLAGADETAPPMWLLSGAGDVDVEDDAQRLRDRGYEAEAIVLPGVTHEGITDAIATPEIVDLIFEAIDSI